MDNSHGNKNTTMDLQSSLQKYIRSAADLSTSYSRLTADQRLGVTHATVGLLFLIMGLSFFFQSLLLSIGNGFIIYGIIEVVGVESFLKFLKPTDDHTGNYGVLALGVSLILIMNGWGMIGFLLELYSIYYTLRERCDNSELTGLLIVAQDFITQRLKYLPVVRSLLGLAIDAPKVEIVEDAHAHPEAVQELATRTLRNSPAIVDDRDGSTLHDRTAHVHHESADTDNKHVDHLPQVVEHSTAPPVCKETDMQRTDHEAQDLTVPVHQQSNSGEISAKDGIESAAEIDKSKHENTGMPEQNLGVGDEHVQEKIDVEFVGSADIKHTVQTNGYAEQHSSQHEGEGDKSAVEGKKTEQAENPDKQNDDEPNKVAEHSTIEAAITPESEFHCERPNPPTEDSAGEKDGTGEETRKLDIPNSEATEFGGSPKPDAVSTEHEHAQ